MEQVVRGRDVATSRWSESDSEDTVGRRNKHLRRARLAVYLCAVVLCVASAWLSAAALSGTRPLGGSSKANAADIGLPQTISTWHDVSGHSMAPLVSTSKTASVSRPTTSSPESSRLSSSALPSSSTSSGLNGIRGKVPARLSRSALYLQLDAT